MIAGRRRRVARRRVPGAVAVAVCLTALALAPPAKPETSSAALIQLRVDQIRDGSPATIAGDTLASAVVLPDFYERRGFEPAWTDAKARDDLRPIGCTQP